MAAHCCTIGVTHDGEAKGEYITLGSNTEAYITYPPSKSTENGIILLTDVIGHRFLNSQLIADQLAANGYFVVMPDLFHGNPVKMNGPPGFEIMEWIKEHHETVVDPVIEEVVGEMRGRFGCKRVGAAGYCFGAKYVVRFLTPGENKVDVGYIAHPGFVEIEELRLVTGPLSFAAAETDEIFPTLKRHQSEVILQERGVPYQINLYGGVEHGFAVRGDMANKVVKFAKEQAFLQAVNWFDELLKV